MICFLVEIFYQQNFTFAENQKEFYAKIQNTGVYLCSTPSEVSSLFEIPYSYFVKVDYSVDDYFKVTYQNVEGYVKKDKVSLMNGTPQQPYAQATFKVFVPYALYETPNQNSSIKAQINTTNSLNYLGTKAGQQVSSSSNTWYYCNFSQDGQVVCGYVFSGITDVLTPITTNTETFEIVKEDILNPSTTEFKSLSTGTKVMLIVAISVPSLLILYFLIKPSKIMQITKTKKQVKKESRRIRHGDYFEFDESEL